MITPVSVSIHLGDIGKSRATSHRPSDLRPSDLQTFLLPLHPVKNEIGYMSKKFPEYKGLDLAR